MQREIASVMAACGMRNIRYVAFPPVVFEAPARAITPEPLPAPLEAAPPTLAADPFPVVAEAVPPPAPEPMEAAPLPAEAPPVLAAAPAEVAPPAPARPVLPIPLAPVVMEAPPEPAAAAAPLPPAASLHAAPRPGMRRLAELAAEVAEAGRPRRGAQPKAPPHAPPLTALTEGEAPAGVVPLRNFALLQDIAGELRPRRVRARSGKRA